VSNTQPAGPNRPFALLIGAVGVIEIALAVGFAAFAGQGWIMLLALFAIPNFWLAWRQWKGTA